VALVGNRMNLDSPIGDLPLEPERLDADRIRQAEAANVSRGRQTYNTGVRRNGRLVGWTAVAALLDDPQRAWQQITLVLPEDRGHRLGMVLKLENLRFVRGRQPELRYLDTFNALSNEHMLSINRQIGFAPAESIIHWRLDV
jgi:hypothetical protein